VDPPIDVSWLVSRAERTGYRPFSGAFRGAGRHRSTGRTVEHRL